jgi:hypothetical protein
MVAVKTVNLQKISDRLTHEIANHPIKGALLGVLVLIGLYFWIPALWHRINKDNADLQLSAMTQPAEAQSIPGRDGTIDGGTNANKAIRRSWKEIMKLMENDPQTRPAGPLTAIKDPFHGPNDARDKKMIEEQVKEILPPVSPDSLGMTLTSTIIGPHEAIARINGTMYAQGQTIQITKNGRTHKFNISEIRDGCVILEGEGGRYELSIPEPSKSGQMVLGD